MGNQFLTIELKPGEVYWEKTVLDGEDNRSCGLYHDNDCIEEFLKFSFMPILRDHFIGK